MGPPIDSNISTEEKTALVSAILAEIAKRAVSKRLLSSLFAQHIANPAARVTQAELSKELYGEDTTLVDSKVRTAAARLRKAIRRYFEGVGAVQPLRVEIPEGAYALVFSRFVPTDDVIAWFWGDYFSPEAVPTFGLVAPARYKEASFNPESWEQDALGAVFGEYIHDLLYLQGELNDFFNANGKGLDLLAIDWNSTSITLDETLSAPEHHLILIGDYTVTVTALPPERYVTNTARPAIQLFTDPLGRVAAAVLDPLPGQNPILFDSNETTYVVVVRYVTLPKGNRVTIVGSGDPRASVEILSALLSEEFLRMIASRPEFRTTEGSPSAFMMLFAVHYSSIDGQQTARRGFPLGEGVSADLCRTSTTFESPFVIYRDVEIETADPLRPKHQPTEDSKEMERNSPSPKED